MPLDQTLIQCNSGSVDTHEGDLQQHIMLELGDRAEEERHTTGTGDAPEGQSSRPPETNRDISSACIIDEALLDPQAR